MLVKEEGVPEARQEAAAQVEEMTSGNSTIIVSKHQQICYLLT